MIKLENDKRRNMSKPNKIALILIAVIMMLLLATRCSAQRLAAQLDTIYCDARCITEFIVDTKKADKPKVYAVYADREQEIYDIIPVSKTVYEYIVNCKKYNIIPNLGIKLKNGQIVSIIRFKQKYRVKHG